MFFTQAKKRRHFFFLIFVPIILLNLGVPLDYFYGKPIPEEKAYSLNLPENSTVQEVKNASNGVKSEEGVLEIEINESILPDLNEQERTFSFITYSLNQPDVWEKELAFYFKMHLNRLILEKGENEIIRNILLQNAPIDELTPTKVTWKYPRPVKSSDDYEPNYEPYDVQKISVDDWNNAKKDSYRQLDNLVLSGKAAKHINHEKSNVQIATYSASIGTFSVPSEGDYFIYSEKSDGSMRSFIDNQLLFPLEPNMAPSIFVKNNGGVATLSKGEHKVDFLNRPIGNVELKIEPVIYGITLYTINALPYKRGNAFGHTWLAIGRKTQNNVQLFGNFSSFPVEDNENKNSWENGMLVNRATNSSIHIDNPWDVETTLAANKGEIDPDRGEKNLRVSKEKIDELINFGGWFIPENSNQAYYERGLMYKIRTSLDPRVKLATSIELAKYMARSNIEQAVWFLYRYVMNFGAGNLAYDGFISNCTAYSMNLWQKFGGPFMKFRYANVFASPAKLYHELGN